MKTAKEFFDRMSNDESFATEVTAAVQARREAGAANYYETIIPVAKEHGYEISEEELDSILQPSQEELSEDELGKVAGGTSCWGVATASASIVLISVSVVGSLSVKF